MSNVIAAPDMMTSAAMDAATIGSNVSAAHMVAAAWTTSVIPAAADEVSASIAHLFSRHAQDYQAIAARAAAFQQQFVQNLTASASSYASSEAANASLLHSLNVASNSLVSNLGTNPVRSAAVAAADTQLADVLIVGALILAFYATLLNPLALPVFVAAAILLLSSQLLPYVAYFASLV
jgi:hypothetical protein